jgi:hypothetical protein
VYVRDSDPPTTIHPIGYPFMTLPPNAGDIWFTIPPNS